MVLLGVVLLTSTPSYAGGGDVFTLSENDGAMMNTFRDIQSLPSLPPGAINPATGSPFTTPEEFGGLTAARQAGGWGIPALNALSTLAIGGTAIYSAYQLGDFFRSKIRGDQVATISGPKIPTWQSYCAAGGGENGSSCFSTTASQSLGNFGGYGTPPAAIVGVGSTFAPTTGYWILLSQVGIATGGFCVTAGPNCTGASADNNASDMATAQSIYTNNPTLTNESFNTSAGTSDCKAIGACVMYWRTFDQMRKATQQETCTTACYSGANRQSPLAATPANGAAANNLQVAEEACGGFLGNTVGTPQQEACRAALNYEVNPSCTTGCTGTSTPTVTIPGTVTVIPFAPFVVPEPVPTETYKDYLERLREKGYVGTVTIATVVTDSVLTGPEGVVSVEDTTASLGPDALPWPDNPFTIPAKDDALTIRVNSPTAPEVAPAAGDCSTCAIDWTPIEGLDIGSKFPFGVPTWLSTFFGTVSFADSCPTLSIGKPSALGGGSIDIPFCSAEWESTYRPIVFPILEALMTLAAITFLGSKIFGIGGGEEE